MLKDGASGGRHNFVCVGRNGRMWDGVYGGIDVGGVCVDWNVCEHIYKGMWGLCMDILGCVWETRGVWRDRWGCEHVEKLMCMYLCV